MKNRRCDSNGCLIAATKEATKLTIDLPIANILTNAPRDWKHLTQGNRKFASANQRSINVDWNKFNPNDYLFTHCSICASSNVADNGYYIENPTDELVNSNGNSWSTPVLLSTFKTFIGAENYFEHQQIPALSKGKILDVVLRPVLYKSKKSDTSANVLYADILVATNRKHNELITRIIGGELTTLSMGGIAHVVQCSKCGKELRNDETCEHIDNELLSYFEDENGVERIVSELCGRSYIDQTTGTRVGDPSSFEFIEASWVENPAFKGAVVNHYVSELNQEDSKFASIINMPTKGIYDLYGSLMNVKVADVNGRIALKIAKQELSKRKREAGIIDRVEIWAKGE